MILFFLLSAIIFDRFSLEQEFKPQFLHCDTGSTWVLRRSRYHRRLRILNGTKCKPRFIVAPRDTNPNLPLTNVGERNKTQKIR